MDGWVHTVKPGDTLARIAKAAGLRQWHRLYQVPENAELRRLRPDPELLAPGDQVFVPFREPKWQLCQTNAVNEFVLERPVHRLPLRLVDTLDSPVVGARYELALGGATHEGVVPESGVITHDVDLEVQQATLRLRVAAEHGGESELVLELEVGHLDPIEVPSGVQGRLTNLGLYEGDRDGEIGSDTEVALSRFRRTVDPPLEDDVEEAQLHAVLRERAGV